MNYCSGLGKDDDFSCFILDEAADRLRFIVEFFRVVTLGLELVEFGDRWLGSLLLVLFVLLLFSDLWLFFARSIAFSSSFSRLSVWTCYAINGETLPLLCLLLQLALVLLISGYCFGKSL